MNGTGSNTFSPNASTTRGMLMTVLALAMQARTPPAALLWYEKGMNWAKAKGVSDGTHPTVNITREQLVTMLYRYAGSPKANGSLNSFSDAASVNSYAANAMQWAVANGIVNGLNGKLNPQNNATPRTGCRNPHAFLRDEQVNLIQTKSTASAVLFSVFSPFSAIYYSSRSSWDILRSLLFVRKEKQNVQQSKISDARRDG